MASPAMNTRVRARPAAKTPYSRVNAINKLHPGLQDIVKNCPALDVIFDHDNPRTSTHSRGRGRDKEHVARPPNAFMVYRSYVWYTKQLENNDEKNLSCVSQLAAQSWRVMSEQARAPFKQVADAAKREHAERNPDYKYAPSSRLQKTPRKTVRKAPKAKAKAKVKEATPNPNSGCQPSLRLKEGTATRDSATATLLEAIVKSFESDSSSSSPSSSSSSSPDTSPIPWCRPLIPRCSPASPELGYVWDCTLPGYPPRPRSRPTATGLIPSPAISVLQLNTDEPPPSILDELPDKYEEAGSYHNLQPHAFGFKQEMPFDANANPDTRIPIPVRAESIDYSSFISGNPEVKFGLPTPVACIPDPDGRVCFSPVPAMTTVISDVFNSPLSPTLKWSAFEMPTLGSDRIVDETGMYSPSENELFDAVITCGGY